MARAKHTARAEARRRYRQTMAESSAAELDDVESNDEALDYGEGPTGDRSGGRSERPAPAAEKRDANARLGFAAAFRAAYRPARVREDLRLLPQLLTSRAFILAALLVFIGAGAILAFPGYDGSAFAFELLVWPGSAIGPQLVAGFLAPRASYLLGFAVGLIQGSIFTILLTSFADRLGASVPVDQISNVLFLGFVSGPFSGLLFAASAAWYRRFLTLTSRRPVSRGGSRSGSERRTSRR